MLTESIDLLLFQNIQTHQIQANQVHSVFVQVCIVLLLITLCDFSILLDNSIQIAPNILIVTERIVRQIYIQEDLCIQILTLRFIHIQMNSTVLELLIPIVKRGHRGLARGKNLFFFFRLVIAVTSQSCLQTAKLLSSITAEGMDGFLREEHISLFHHHSSNIVKEHILFRLTAQQLNRIRIAVRQQMDQLIKTVNGSVCCVINYLFEIGSSKNIGSGIKRTTTNINIRIRRVRTVCVTSTKCCKNHRPPKVRVCLDKIVLRTIQNLSNIHINLPPKNVSCGTLSAAPQHILLPHHSAWKVPAYPRLCF